MQRAYYRILYTVGGWQTIEISTTKQSQIFHNAAQGLALQTLQRSKKTWTDLETFDLPEGGLLDPP